MKKSSKIIASVLAMSSALGFAGCGDNGGSVKTIVSYKVVGVEEQYDINSTFDLSNLELEFTWSDHSTSKVKVTQEMLDALPDMTTVGDKEIKITYDGKEYTFSLQVIDKKANMLALLNSFLADYNSETIKSSSLSVDYSALVKYLGESTEVNETLFNLFVSRVNDLKGYKIYKYENGVYYFEKKFENSADLNQNAYATNNGWFRAFGIDYCIRAYCDESSATAGEAFMITGGNIDWEHPTYPSGGIHDIETSMDMKTIMQKYSCKELTLEDFAKSLNINIGKSAILNGTMGDIITLNSNYVGLYRAIINWVVNSVSSIEKTDIVSADENLSANLNLSVEPIKQMINEITLETTYDFVINRLIFVETDEVYAERFAKAIMDNLNLQEDSVTYPRLKYRMLKLIEGLRKSVPSVLFVKSNLTEINNVLQESSLPDVVKSELDVLVDGINENDKNTISKLIKNLSQFPEIRQSYTTEDRDVAFGDSNNLCWKIENGFEDLVTGEVSKIYYYYKRDEQKVGNSDALVQKYFDNMAGIVEAFENATDPSEFVSKTFINGIIANLRGMDEVLVEIEQNNYYGSSLPEIKFTQDIKELIEAYKEFYNVKDAEFGNKTGFETLLEIIDNLHFGLQPTVKQEITAIGEIIYDAFNVSGDQKIDYVALVERIADRLGEDKQTYIDAYNDGTLTLITDVFDNILDVDTIIKNDSRLEDVMDALRSACEFGDQIILGNKDKDQIIDGIQTHTNKCATAYYNYLNACKQEQESGEFEVEYDYDTELEIWSNIIKLTDVQKTIENRVRGLIQDYKDTIVHTASTSLIPLLGLDVSNDLLVKDMEKRLSPYVQNLIDGQEIDYNQLITDINEFVAIYCKEKDKTLFESITMVLMVVGNYGKDVDYNELLKDINLPNEIKDVDYNKLINEVLQNRETWEIFKLDNVKVDYVLDDNGKLIREIMTLNLNIDYDLMLTSLDSNLTLKFEIDF